MIPQEIIDQAKRDEGFSPVLYKCPADKWSIGFGLNLEAGITESEAEMLLKMRLEKIYTRLCLSLQVFRSLSVKRQGVLVNIAYNCGFRGLLGFKKMIAALYVPDYDEAAKEILDSKAGRELKERYKRFAADMISG